MRLLRLRLQNFRCFIDETIEFAAATVLIGPNDAGKSTVLEALRFLLLGDDRFGEAFSYETTVRRSRGPEEPGPVVVLAEFGDLTENEAHLWGNFASDGRIRAGAMFADSERLGPCVVLTKGHHASLANDERRHLGSAAYEADGDLWFNTQTSPVLEAGRRFFSLPLPELVFLPGPEVPTPSPGALLEPFIAEAASRMYDELPDGLGEGLNLLADQFVDRLSDALTRTLPHYLGSANWAILRRSISDPDELVYRAIMAGLEDLEVIVTADPFEPASSNQTAAEAVPADGIAFDELGGGARRATLMAILELYLDDEVRPLLFPSLILALEEPEVGLDPVAQRRVARSLRRVPGFALQSIVVTHSPILVDAAGEDGLRVVRQLAPGVADKGVPRHVVLRPEGIEEVARAIGATPADVLLGDRFLVVEGASDAGILKTWGHTLGVDLDWAGVRLYVADGYGQVEIAARVLELAYPAAKIAVVLDSGRDTKKKAAEMEARYGGRFSVTVLGRNEIEAYFSRRAVNSWLASQGVDLASMSDVLDRLLDDGPRKEKLRRIAEEHLGRAYRVEADGVAIAGLMTEGEIPPDIVGLITALTN